MTTLTPEKEAEALATIKQVVAQRLKGAERDVRRGVADSLPDALAYATVPGLLVKHLQALLSTLSTERQARADAEKDAAHWKHQHRAQCEVSQELDDERVAAIEAAEKEVERLEAECIQKCINCQVAWEAKLAALSALPPPVPPEEGEAKLPRTPTEQMVEAGLYHASADSTSADIYTIWTAMFDSVTMDGGCTDALPAQAQDVAGLVEEAEFLIARLNDFALTGFDDDPVREFHGHVTPSAARLKSILSALLTSPISHESKALELAAADNNREALVRALDFRALANRFLGWPVPSSVRSDRCMTMTHAEYPHGRNGTSMMGPDEAENMLRYVLSAVQAAT